MESLAAKSLIVDVVVDHGIILDSVTTDRSTDMKAMMSEIFKDLPNDYILFRHEYDIWHWIVAVQRDLWTASKLVSCAGLEAWIPSITNMIWWSFSSSIGNLTLLQEKLDSIPDHVSNKHEFLENKEHRCCAHDPLPPNEERCKAWLLKNSLPVSKIRAALHGHQNSRWNDLAMMTHFTHTGDIENFNSLMNKYCPKMYAYSHESMLCRGALAALDHNGNVGRSQKVTIAGERQYDLMKKRYGKKYFIKAVKEEKDFSFRDELASLVLTCIKNGTRPSIEIPVGREMPSVLKSIEKPDKMEAILKHQSRFVTV